MLRLRIPSLSDLRRENANLTKRELCLDRLVGILPDVHKFCRRTHSRITSITQTNVDGDHQVVFIVIEQRFETGSPNPKDFASAAFDYAENQGWKVEYQYRMQ